MYCFGRRSNGSEDSGDGAGGLQELRKRLLSDSPQVRVQNRGFTVPLVYRQTVFAIAHRLDTIIDYDKSKYRISC